MAVNLVNMYSGAVATFKIGGVDIGGTHDGVEITREDTFSEGLNCDQVKSPIDPVLISRTFSVVTNLAELTLANLEKALGQKSGNLTSSSLNLTDDDQGSTYLEITVPAPTGVGTRTIKFDTVYNVAGGGTAYKKDGTQSVIPVTFSCRANSSGQYGYLGDAA